MSNVHFVSVLDLIRHRRESQGAQRFLTYIDPDDPKPETTYSYSDAADIAAGIFDLLSGYRSGEISPVIIRCNNGPGMALALLGIMASGLTAVPTILQYAPDELAFAISHSGSRIVLCDIANEDAVRQAVSMVGSGIEVVVLPEDILTLAKAMPGMAMPAVAADRAAMVGYTSGTTSRPKGAVLSHSAMLMAAQGTADAIRLQPNDVHYCVLPLFHVNALMFQLFPALVTGSTVLLSPRFSASRYWEMARAGRATVGNLTGGPIRMLLELPPRHDDRAHSMRVMMYSMPLTGDEIQNFEDRFGMPLSMGYGLTETSSCATRTPLFMNRKPSLNSVGTPLPGWTVRIYSPTGLEARAGEVGEIRISGPGLMTGYLNDAAATSDAFIGDELRTGDLGSKDSEGYVTFVGRSSSMIKVKGENVAPEEVERVLLSIPEVQDAAATGMPHRYWDEQVVALVVPAEGCTEALARERVLKVCRDQLAEFKAPQAIFIVDAIPRTEAVGKPRRSEIASIAEKLSQENLDHG